MNIRFQIKKALLCIGLACIVNSVFSQNKILKELYKELPYSKGGAVKITNNKWNLNIRTWSQDKVKLSIQVDGNADSLMKTDWAAAIGVNFSATPTGTEIKVLNLPNGRDNLKVQQVTKDVLSEGTGVTQPTVLNNAQGVNKLTNPPQQRAFQLGLVPANTAMSLEVITIYIPENATLEINNNHTSVLITGDVSKAVLNLNNANVVTGNISKLKVTASLSNLNFESIQDAELDLSNGCSFRAKNVTTMDIESKSSRIEYEKGGSLIIRSTIDEYTIDEIDKVEGRKTYGSMRIGQLNNSLQVEGSNADIKIRTISPTVELVKINTLFANLRLPVKNITNYVVKFEGMYSSVYAPFEMVPVTKPDEKPTPTTGSEQEKNGNSNSGTLPSIIGQAPNQFGQQPNVQRGFTASSGDIKGKHTKIEIVCPQCLVDFK